MRRDLPSGTVTFLFTDIEGSTRLLGEVGEARYVELLAEHRAKLRAAFRKHGGVEVDTQGDAFFYAFADPKEAAAAASEAQAGLASGPVQVRMGLHTGEPRLTEEGYAGREVHRAARIAAASHGGQVVISRETRELLGDSLLVTDLGEHRVKDFDETVWIYQLGAEQFPPLKTISNSNLPQPASSFVGREREVGEVASLLRDSARLVTLTGPGGSGKTRLSIEAASELVLAFKNGVFWVPLATLRDPSLVTDTVAQTLGAKAGLAAHISEREILLVLDNFEQVIDAAPELAELVESCPNLRLLVTSREILRIRGEVEFAVPPLAGPEAVELFSQRSRLEADETIAELCRRLDDLPLPIELAAARSAALSPAQILERLSKRLDLLKGGRDAEARQRTLRATIEWSHDLLDQNEQRLFARLAVFRGGCTVGLAETIVDADLDVLQSLVDKSLVRHTGERFWMLETIREYAIERLEASGEGDDLGRRHAEHFLMLAEEAAPHLSDSKLWLDRLEVEHDNLRAALDWLDGSGEGAREQRLTAALWRFWQMRGHYAEAKRLLQRALHADPRPTEARAWTAFGAGVITSHSEKSGAATRLLEEASAMFESFGNAFGVARVGMNLGVLALDRGDNERGWEIFESVLRAFDGLGEERWVAVTMRYLAWAHYELGDLAGARALHEEVIGRARAMGNRHLEAESLGALGEYAAIEGSSEEVVERLGESTRIFLELGDPQYIGMNLCRFARALAVAGHAEAAAVVLARGEALHEEIGSALAPWLVALNRETRNRIHEKLADSAAAEANERGQKATVEEAFELALDELQERSG